MATDREKTDWLIPNQVRDNTAPVRVTQCRHNTERLVQKKIGRFFRGSDRFAVNQHPGVLRIGLITQLGHPAVDADPALGNQVFSATP